MDTGEWRSRATLYLESAIEYLRAGELVITLKRLTALIESLREEE